MIRFPKTGHRVRLNYAVKAMPHQGKTGWVAAFNGKAKGPKNALINLDEGGAITVPRGNLIAL